MPGTLMQKAKARGSITAPKRTAGAKPQPQPARGPLVTKDPGGGTTIHLGPQKRGGKDVSGKGKGKTKQCVVNGMTTQCPSK